MADITYDDYKRGYRDGYRDGMNHRNGPEVPYTPYNPPTVSYNPYTPNPYNPYGPVPADNDYNSMIKCPFCGASYMSGYSCPIANCPKSTKSP